MKEMTFNLLEIDLTTGEKTVVDMTQDMRKHIGGRGLGAKILWDRVPEATDPLGDENVLGSWKGGRRRRRQMGLFQVSGWTSDGHGADSTYTRAQWRGSH